MQEIRTVCTYMSYFKNKSYEGISSQLAPGQGFRSETENKIIPKSYMPYFVPSQFSISF